MNNLIKLAKPNNNGKRIFSNTNKPARRHTFFSQQEFRKILATYSAQVAKGAWKDYAIDYNNEKACFSIYRHSFEYPVFQISKGKNGKFQEFALTTRQRTLKRSRELSTILKLLNDPFKII